MDIAEIMIARSQVEEKVHRLLMEFEYATKVEICGIDLERVSDGSLLRVALDTRIPPYKYKEPRDPNREPAYRRIG